MLSGEIVPQGIGKYRPIAMLGQGGMARVLLTISSGPAGVRKLLVVKQMRPEIAQDNEFVHMFLDEARLAARLSHPNVIHTYEVGIDSGGPYIVMEYLNGQSLQALISKVKRANMPLALQLRILTKVLAGLDYAHELRDYDGSPLAVVHRDMSPQNVFVCYDGQIKVVDFGVAKVAGIADRTAAGTFKGKIGYIAPEQVSGAPVDRRADVFSVGVMLWEALAERRLTANETAVSALHKRVHGMHPGVRDVNPGVPKELAAICDKATAFALEERFSSAAQMREALENFMDKAGMRADERDIGALVSDAFAAERTRINEIIEQQIGRVSEGDLRQGLPNLAVDIPLGSLPPASTGSSSPSFTVTRAAFRSPHVNRWAMVGAGVAVATLLGVLVARWNAPAGSPQASTAPTPSATVASSAQAAVEPGAHTMITLTIRVTPAKATVLLDGAMLATNPFHSTVLRDSKPHKVSASAPGYLSEERLLQYDEDTTVDLVLKHVSARAAGPSAAAVTAGANPAPGSDLKKAPRSKHAIDEEDPYK